MNGNTETERFSAETSGVINTIEVDIRVEGEDEHLAELILQDLESRAEEINQIVEIGRHPKATNPPHRIDWEGWQRGDYDGVKEAGSDE